MILIMCNEGLTFFFFSGYFLLKRYGRPTRVNSPPFDLPQFFSPGGILNADKTVCVTIVLLK